MNQKHRVTFPLKYLGWGCKTYSKSSLIQSKEAGQALVKSPSSRVPIFGPATRNPSWSGQSCSSQPWIPVTDSWQPRLQRAQLPEACLQGDPARGPIIDTNHTKGTVMGLLWQAEYEASDNENNERVWHGNFSRKQAITWEQTCPMPLTIIQTHNSDYENESNKCKLGAVCVFGKSPPGAEQRPSLGTCVTMCACAFWNTWISFDLI